MEGARRVGERSERFEMMLLLLGWLPFMQVPLFNSESDVGQPYDCLHSR